MRWRKNPQISNFCDRQEEQFALSLKVRELTALVTILEHAHSQIAKLGDVDRKTAEKASGSHIISTLYARAGLAATQGDDELPLLPSEFGLLEAAVVNLESYEGYAVILCSGYELLAALSLRRKENRPVHRVHGILSFLRGDQGLVNGMTTPSAPESGGPRISS